MGEGIRINTIVPGAIDTPMLRGSMPPENDAAYFRGCIARRAGTAEEVAAAIGFLAGEAASYINGSCIDVNGGLLMR